jgi:hypothetical protein
MKIQNLQTSNLNPNLASEFRRLASEICALVINYGLETKPYHDPEIPHFRGLEMAEQEKIVASLRSYLESIVGAERAGINLANGKQALWHFLRSSGYLPCSEMMNELGDHEVLEIYDAAQNLQVWRNFAFLRICSYTLEEMFCFTWQKRYTRGEASTQQILAAVEKVLDPANRSVVLANVKSHQLLENFSEHGYELLARHDKFFPLFSRHGHPSGFLVTSGVEIIGKHCWPSGNPGITPSYSSPGLSLL